MTPVKSRNFSASVNNRKNCDILGSGVSRFSCVLELKLWFCLFLQLTQITRTGQSAWESKNILAVSFAPLVQQSRADGDKPDTVHLRESS